MEQENFRSITIRLRLTDRRGIRRLFQRMPDPIRSVGRVHCVSVIHADAINPEWQDRFLTFTLANTAIGFLVHVFRTSAMLIN